MNPRRRHKRRTRGRHRRPRIRGGRWLYNPRRGRTRGSRRRYYRRNEPEPRRRRRGAGGGIAGPMGMMPVIGTGVIAGLAVGWATPFAARWFNLPPAGLMYRLAQAGVAWGLAWIAQSMGLLRRSTANIFAGFGFTFSALGLLQDFQAGLVGGLTPAAALPAPAAPPALTGMGYESGREYIPYGSRGMSYYQAI